MSAFLGIHGYQWLLLLAAIQGALLMADAFVGHYRSGFDLRAQYAPFAIAALLVVTAVAAAIMAGSRLLLGAGAIAGTLALAGGIVGVVYHHWYGIATKPGGYRWLLHHLMHHAPPLAPFALSAAGALEVLAVAGAAGDDRLLGMPIRALVLGVVGAALIGASFQAGLLHYRGAYNNPFMYVPVALLPVAGAASFWNGVFPGGRGSLLVGSLLLGMTVLAGFVGSGMHLRGMDRQMGGLHMGVAAVLDAPPAGAPLFVAALGATGLVALRLL